LWERGDSQIEKNFNPGYGCQELRRDPYGALVMKKGRFGQLFADGAVFFVGG
jgi:hypothetical protein